MFAIPFYEKGPTQKDRLSADLVPVVHGSSK